MTIAAMGAEIGKSALIIVDMQNDFVHPEGGFARLALEHPEAVIDMPFLMGTIPHVKRLADAFREAGRPVLFLAKCPRLAQCGDLRGRRAEHFS